MSTSEDDEENDRRLPRHDVLEFREVGGVYANWSETQNELMRLNNIQPLHDLVPDISGRRTPTSNIL